MVVREVLDNGLRLITEAMPHVRSVTIGVWLMRGRIGGIQVHFAGVTTSKGLVDPKPAAHAITTELHGRLGGIAGALDPAEDIARGIGHIHPQRRRLLLLRPARGPRQQTESKNGNFEGKTHGSRWPWMCLFLPLLSTHSFHP